MGLCDCLFTSFIVIACFTVGVVEKSAPKYVDSGELYFRHKHDKYGRYCGFNHNTDPFNPVDKLDKCCYEHDMCVCANSVKNMTCHEGLLTCLKHVQSKKDETVFANTTMAEKIFETLDKADKCIKLYEKINNYVEVRTIELEAGQNKSVQIDLYLELLSIFDSNSYIEEFHDCQEFRKLILT